MLTAAALREPPQPNRDALIRPLATSSDWQQAVELQAISDAADGGPASRTFIEARYAARRRAAEAGHGAWFGAFRDGELVAQLGIFSAPGAASPGSRTSGRTRPPGARAWPARWSGRPASTRSISSAPARW